VFIGALSVCLEIDEFCGTLVPKFPSLRSPVEESSESVSVCQGILRKETLMNRTFHLATTALLLCCGVFSFAQTTTPPTEQKPAPPATSSDKKQEASASNSNTQADTTKTAAMAWRRPTATMGPLEVLTDTMGVDFGPYLQRVLHDVRENWYNLIPASAKSPMRKKGKVVIEFAIKKDGTVVGMQLMRTSGDVELDRGGWGGITASNPFPPLPSEFGGPYIGLRFTFYYNPDADLGVLASSTGHSSPKSGIKVSISQPDIGNVPIGGSQVVDATVTGSTNTAVNWNVTGVGCVGSACGTMSGDLYLAPKVLPSPSSVVLTAISEADPTASAWVTVQLVQPDTSH
jgi:TonB family protein